MFEFLAIASGWSAVAFVVVVSWCAFNAKRPRTAAPRAKCSCNLCTGRVSVRELLLTSRQLADVQDGVVAVGLGLTHVATLGFDYVSGGGVGQVVVVVVDAPMFGRVVAPAIQRHLTARARA